MTIHIDVLENGKIELVDIKNRTWSEHESIPKALAELSRILRHRIKRVPKGEFAGYTIQ